MPIDPATVRWDTPQGTATPAIDPSSVTWDAPAAPSGAQALGDMLRLVPGVSTALDVGLPIGSGIRRGEPAEGFRRGAASSLAGALHAGSDFIDQQVLAPTRTLYGYDPLGFDKVAEQSLGAEREINKDRAEAAARIGGQVGLGDLAANPSSALEQAAAHITNVGAESAPAMALALATRNPELASSLLGGVTGAQSYTDLRGQGVPRGDAAQAAAITGAVETAGESFGLPAVFGKLGKGSAARAILGEGLQEGPVQIGQQYAEDQATGQETPIKQQLADALDAMIVGGAMGGGGHVATNIGDIVGQLTGAEPAAEITPAQPQRAPAPATPQAPVEPAAPAQRTEVAPENAAGLDALLDTLLSKSAAEQAPPATPAPAPPARAPVEPPVTPVPVQSRQKVAVAPGSPAAPVSTPEPPPVNETQEAATAALSPELREAIDTDPVLAANKGLAERAATMDADSFVAAERERAQSSRAAAETAQAEARAGRQQLDADMAAFREANARWITSKGALRKDAPEAVREQADAIGQRAATLRRAEETAGFDIQQAQSTTDAGLRAMHERLRGRMGLREGGEAPATEEPPEIDDTPEPRLNIQYGKRRAPAFSARTNSDVSGPEALESLSPIKSVEANVRRGREAMARALIEKADQRRAMYRQGLGWVDFVWGDDGTPTGLAGTDLPGKRMLPGKGLAHLIGQRMREDGMSRQGAERVAGMMVDTIARGKEVSRHEVKGNTTAIIDHGDHQAMLVRRKGSNTWLLTGWENKAPDSTAAGYVAGGDTLARTSPTRSDEGAGADESVARTPSARNDTGIEAEEIAPEDAPPEARELLDRMRERRESEDTEHQQSERVRQASIDRGEAEADHFGLREAAEAVVPGQQVEFVRDVDGLPPEVRRRLPATNGRRGRRHGLFDPETGRVYVFTDHVQAPADAAWAVAHEVAGHKGFRALVNDRAGVKIGSRTPIEALNAATDMALQNPTVAKLADVIQRQRKTGNRRVGAEEALAELSAATRTGDWDRIAERYGVDVPAAQRTGVKAAIARFVERLRRILNAVRRKGNPGFSDAQVHQLVADAYRYVREPGTRERREGGALESVEPAQTDTPAFRRWFGDSKVVDAEGKPLVMYHGTKASFDAFKDGTGWFAATPEEANFWGGMNDEGSNIVPAYLSIKNPRVLDGAKFANQHDVNNALESLRREEDGVVVMEGGRIRWAVVADKPSQIKSATGNRGTFDPESANILESVDFTPEQQEFMRKAGMGDVVDTRSSVRRALDAIAGRAPNIDKDAMITSGVDRFHGLKRAVKEKGGIAPEDDPYVAAEMIQTASTMEAILRFGAPELYEGALRVNRSVPGLMDALRPVAKQMPQWLGWMVARRAKVLKAQGRENLMSDADIQAGLSLAAGHEQAFKQTAIDYLKLKNAILDLAEDSGTIDPASRALWDHAEYIPFYRDTEGGFAGPGTRQGLSNQSAHIRTLKGGEAALRDPLSNIITNFTQLVDSAMKNRALLMAVDQLGAPYFRKAAYEFKPESIPMDQVKKYLRANGTPESVIQAMPPGALSGMQRMLAMKAPEGEDIVRVMRGGKPEYHHVDDPLLLRAVTAFSEPPTHWGVKPFVWAKQLLTAGATATPDFIIRNALRDTGEASVTSRDRFIPVWDTLRGAVDSFRESELAQDLMMAGASFHGGLFHTGDNAATAKAIRRALRAHGMTQNAAEKYMKSLINPARWWDAYRSISEATEMGSRVSLARLRMKSGAPFVEAAHEAKDFLNFQRRGDDRFIHFFLKAIPFLNARIQGADRLVRTGSQRGRRGKMLARLGIMALASTALYAWNAMMYGDAYDELPDWDKDANWHIAPGTSFHIRIPKPFELGLVGGTMPERMYQAVRYQLTRGEEGDRPEQSWDAFLRGLYSAFGITIAPQAVLPIVEDIANKDFYFDRSIENLGDQYKAPSDRSNAYTSPAMIKASKAMASVFGEDNTISPKRMQHLWRGYTAGMGQYLLDAVDWTIRHVEDAPAQPAMALRDFPLIGTVARGGNPARSTRYTDEFYELLEQARMRSQSVKQAVEDDNPKRASQIESAWRWLIGDPVPSKRAKDGFMHVGLRELNASARDLSKLSKDDQRIYSDPDMTPAEKREALDANAKERNATTRKIVRRLREAERRRSE